jgi:hypothetical protein
MQHDSEYTHSKKKKIIFTARDFKDATNKTKKIHFGFRYE